MITRLIILAVFIGIVLSVIAYARGYRFDAQKKSLTSTGIISVNSLPKAAKIFLNGELKGVTDSNLTLSPGSYEINIKKDGYNGWKRKFNLKGELVLTADALLFPLNPSLSPLTNLGIVKAIPLDQTDRVVLFVENSLPSGEELKDGIYLFESSKKPFMSPLKLLLLKKYLPSDTQFSSIKLYLSPDYKQGILELLPPEETGIPNQAFLLSLDEENRDLFDVTASKDTLLEAWETEKLKDNMKILETFPKEFVKVASDSVRMIAFSPNETKILYRPLHAFILPPAITPPLIATNQTEETRSLKINHYYVYDKKEDKNYDVTQLLPKDFKEDEITYQFPIIWYSDSRHFILNENKKLTIVEYDGNNRQTVYSGPFENNFFATTSDGNLLVLANLNPDANIYPDLYAVGIK